MALRLARVVGGVVSAVDDSRSGALANRIGSWFGTGPDRGMALIFIVAGVIGLLVTVLALGSRPYRELSSRYAAAPTELGGEDEVEVPAA